MERNIKGKRPLFREGWRMRTTLLSAVGLALSILGLAGCGTYAIPRFAVKGTTIMFPVPDGFGAGFGRALNATLAFGDVNPGDNEVGFDPDSPLEDFQRGELLFALRASPSTSEARITYLPVRYITRVHADESSGAALPEEYDNAGTPVQTGQIVAFVDIPYTDQLTAGTYYVFVERWRRPDSESTQFVQLTPTSINFNYWPLPWVAWGATPSPDQGMKLRIVDQKPPGEGAFFHDPTLGFDKWGGGYFSHDHADDLDRLVPNLKLRIWIGNPQTDTYPAAWEMELAYPAGKIEVTGAALGRIHRSGGLVSVSTTSSPSGCFGQGSTRISMIDPDQHSFWVDLVYRLRSPACGRATVSDFTLVGSPKAYDIDGNPISLPPYIDPVYSF